MLTTLTLALAQWGAPEPTAAPAPAPAPRIYMTLEEAMALAFPEGKVRRGTVYMT